MRFFFLFLLGCSSQRGELNITQSEEQYSQEEIEQVIKEWNESKAQIQRLLKSESDLNQLITLLASQQHTPSSDMLLNNNRPVVSHHLEEQQSQGFYAVLNPKLTRTAANNVVSKLHRELPKLSSVTDVSVEMEETNFGERFLINLGPVDSNNAAVMLCKILKKYNEKCAVVIK